MQNGVLKVLSDLRVFSHNCNAKLLATAYVKAMKVKEHLTQDQTTEYEH